jgi:cation diffusion facilitator family transporter
MHTHSLEPWQHSHIFLGATHDRHEFRTWCVVALTLAMMSAEIVGGTFFGSMAVIADGWHMSTHAGALGIAAFACHAHDPRFSFGTGKLGELAGFASAVILALIALAIGYEALIRLTAPVAIHFPEVIGLAALGLAVNLASAWLLFDKDDHRGHQPCTIMVTPMTITTHTTITSVMTPICVPHMCTCSPMR